MSLNVCPNVQEAEAAEARERVRVALLPAEAGDAVKLQLGLPGPRQEEAAAPGAAAAEAADMAAPMEEEKPGAAAAPAVAAEGDADVKMEDADAAAKQEAEQGTMSVEPADNKAAAPEQVPGRGQRGRQSLGFMSSHLSWHLMSFKQPLLGPWACHVGLFDISNQVRLADKQSSCLRTALT